MDLIKLLRSAVALVAFCPVGLRATELVENYAILWGAESCEGIVFSGAGFLDDKMVAVWSSKNIEVLNIETSKLIFSFDITEYGSGVALGGDKIMVWSIQSQCDGLDRVAAKIFGWNKACSKHEEKILIPYRIPAEKLVESIDQLCSVHGCKRFERHFWESYQCDKSSDGKCFVFADSHGVDVYKTISSGDKVFGS